jgi:hypothetical protein
MENYVPENNCFFFAGKINILLAANCSIELPNDKTSVATDAQ